MLDVSGDVHRLDAFERKVLRLAPNRKLRHGDEVRLAGVPVPDVDCEEFPEAAAAIVPDQKDGGQG